MSGGEASVYGSVLLGPAGQTARQLRVRIQVLLTVLLVGTNVIGAVLVFVLSTFVIPSPELEPDLKLALAIGVPVYVGSPCSWAPAGARPGRCARCAGRSRTASPTSRNG